MKRQSMKCTQSGSVLRWTDRVTGSTLSVFDMNSVADSVRSAVFAYGVRQIIADGGADADSLADRVGKMEARANTLIDGTWGTRVARLVDSDIFGAAIAAGLLPDTQEARDKWTALAPKQRRAIGARPDVMAHLPEADDESDDILAGF
jgi:hypothetical protein